MNYFVFSITDRCERDETIDENKIINLDKIITSILGQNGNGRPGEIQHFKIPDTDMDHKVKIIRDNYLCLSTVDSIYSSFLTDFANDLLEAELVEEKDGSKRRHKKITPGILLVKHEKDKLTLLKLEETNSIDKITYELKSAFMTDRRYYKAAIIIKDSINVIDKNRKVANYWAYDFLHLERERDDKQNTDYLINIIINDELVSKDIADTSIRKKISGLMREFVLSESRFEPEEWLDEINNVINAEGISFSNIMDVFSSEVLEFLDESFEIDKNIARKKLKTVIEISQDLRIEAINIEVAIKAQTISFENGYIQVIVPPENRDKIRKLFN